MKKGKEMEMIIVVLAGSNQYSVGAAVTSEVCPTVPGPHQSWGEELKQETVRFSQGKEDCRVSIFLLFTLNQLSNRPQFGFY